MGRASVGTFGPRPASGHSFRVPCPHCIPCVPSRSQPAPESRTAAHAQHARIVPPRPSRITAPLPTRAACGCVLWRRLQASGISTWTTTAHKQQQTDSGLQHKIYFWISQIKYLQHTSEHRWNTWNNASIAIATCATPDQLLKHPDETFETKRLNT